MKHRATNSVGGHRCARRGRWPSSVSLFATVAVLAGCGSQPGRFAARRAAAQETAYQIIQEPDQGYGPLIGVINQAQHSIRMTMYTDFQATAALIAAHGRGVDVKVLLDAAYHGRDTNAAAFEQLRSAGVDVRWALDGRHLQHQKAITIDDSESAVGTGNLIPKYYPTSRDAWILDSNPDDVAAIAATFDTDFTAPAGGHPPAATPAPNLIWSPGAREELLRQIAAATHSVDVTFEEFRDRAVIRALDNAAQRGVACRIVLTTNPAWANA